MFKSFASKRAACAGAALFLLAGTAHCARTIEFVPPAPVAQERVTLRIRYGLAELCYRASTFFADGTIHVVLGCGQIIGPFVPVEKPWLDVDLGHFPAGDYSLAIHESIYSLTPSTTGAFKVAQNRDLSTHKAEFPTVDYTDLWWNSAEPGWGLSVVQHASDRLFAVWFVYDALGRATWYTLQPGGWEFANAYSGPVYKTVGPYFGAPFDPKAVAIFPVGTATLLFDDSTSGTFKYTIDGVTSSKPIARMPY